MDSNTEKRLIRRVLTMLSEGTTHMQDEATSVAVRAYTDADILDREVDGLIQGKPVIVGYSADIPEAGDYFTHELSGLPLLLVRDPDGRVRAFLNVCRHRGTRLVSKCGGKGKSRFVCPYHAWIYDSCGSLVKVPHEEGFPKLDKSERGLVEKTARESFGLIWVDLGASGIDLEAYLGGIAADVKDLKLDSHVLYQKASRVKRLNWKLVFDIFLEAYHIKTAHARTISPIFFDNVGLYERFGPHLRNLFPKRSIETLRGLEAETWSLREHSNILYVLFPNTLILVQPDHVSLLHIWPKGLGECQIESSTFIPEAATTDKARAYWQKNIDILYSAIEEDFILGESIQRGFASGANEALSFGRYEMALKWFHDAVEEAI